MRNARIALTEINGMWRKGETPKDTFVCKAYSSKSKVNSRDDSSINLVYPQFSGVTVAQAAIVTGAA